MSRYKIVGGYEAVKPLAAGRYVIEFAADDRPFYRFPFSVQSIRNEDPYEAPGSRYFIEGAWNDYGNLSAQRPQILAHLHHLGAGQERPSEQALGAL